MGNSALGLMVDGLGVQVGVYQDLRARLDLFGEAIVLTRFEDGVATSCFEVSPVELATAFSGLPLSTGLLPRDCVFYTRRGDEVLVGIYVAAQRRELTVVAPERRVYAVPLPPLVFCGCGRRYRVWAVKQRPGERERLFRAPLPNVGGDGIVCAGDVQFPDCETGTIRDALDLFFASEFNDHLANGKSTEYQEDVTRLWAALDGGDEFPLEDLVRTRWVLADVMEGEDVA